MKRLVLILLLLVELGGCSSEAHTEKAVIVSPEGVRSAELSVEIADTDGKRRLGLMYRREMAKTSGMLFVFPEEESRSFWMKNTYIPLDMLFLDSNGTVVSILHNVPPLNESMRESGKPARYVLEILGGTAKEWQVAEGAKLELLTGPILRSEGQ